MGITMGLTMGVTMVLLTKNPLSIVIPILIPNGA